MCAGTATENASLTSAVSATMTTIDTTRTPRGGPALALLMRGAFALLAQTLVATRFRLRHHPTPCGAAAAWWMVHSFLADLGCLAVLC